MSGVFAYVAGGGLQIVDLSDPLDPRLRGSTTVDEPPYAYEAIADGDYAYLSTSDGIETYDATDPDAPELRNVVLLDDFCSCLDCWNGHLHTCS